MSKIRKIFMIVVGAVIVLAIALMDVFFRGKRTGQAGQEAKDARRRVEEAAKRGDTDAIDKEWE